ncbi:hypothetical protein [Streptosporangium roseum]
MVPTTIVSRRRAQPSSPAVAGAVSCGDATVTGRVMTERAPSA